MIYKGWVPVVGKRLSFSIVGDSVYPTLSINANKADTKKRYVIAYQKRFLSDSPFPIPFISDDIKNFILKTLTKNDGIYWFLLVAEASNDLLNPDDCMKGSIYIYRDKKIWRKKIEAHIRKAQSDLSNYEGKRNTEDYADVNSSKKFFGMEEIVNALKFPENNYHYAIDFILERNGIATFRKKNEEELLNIDNIYHDSISKIVDDSQSEKVVIDQCFFFLKDLAHTHQHHHHRTETITNLFECNTDDPDDSKWMYDTLRSLYRKVLQYKRVTDNTEGLYFSLKGVLAYTDTFVKIMNENLGKENHIPLLREHKNIEESIEASEGYSSLISNRKIRLKQTVINLCLSLAAFLIALAGLARFDSSIDINLSGNYVKILLLLVLSDPLKVIVIFTFFAVLYIFLSGRIDWKNKIVLDLIRSSIPLKRKWLSLIFIMAGIGVAVFVLDLF